MKTISIKKEKIYHLTSDFFELIAEEIDDFTTELKFLGEAEEKQDEIKMFKRLQAARATLNRIIFNQLQCNIDRLSATIMEKR